MAAHGEETQIACKFTTKLPDEYRVPPSTVVRDCKTAHNHFKGERVVNPDDHDRLLCRLSPLNLHDMAYHRSSTIFWRSVSQHPPRIFCRETCSSYLMLVLDGILIHAEPARPFDFLVKGELVRQKLEQLLLAHEISAVSSACLA